MNEEILISIIIPVYNVEPYIIECLESVVNQSTTSGVECIVVDDCGNDRSIDIAKSFVAHYDGDVKFHFIRHSKNRGLSASRNSGIRVACGKYLLFLDSDDYLLPSCIAQFTCLVNKYKDVDVVQGNLYSEDTNDVLFQKGRYPVYTKNKKWIQSNIAKLRIPESACIKLIRRDLILKGNLFFKEGWIQEDTMWSYSIHDSINSMAFCYDPIYYYRKNPHSIMHSSGRQKEAGAFIRIFNDVYNSLLEKEIHPYDLRFLEIISMRVEKANGTEGYNELTPANNFLFKIIFYNNSLYLRNSSSLLTRVACKAGSFVVRNLLCIRQLYKLN